jgi:HEAT repeat protein
MVRAEGVPKSERRAVIEALLKSLDRRGSHPNETFARSAAAMTLGHLGPSAAESVPDLVRCLQDADSRVRTACAWALGGGPLEPTPSRWMAFRNARGGFAQAGAPAVPDLIVALHDVDPSVQWSAAQSLGHLGEAAQPAIVALRALVESELAGESQAAPPKPTLWVDDPAAYARARNAQLTSGAFQARNVTPKPRYILARSAQPIGATVAPTQQANPHENVIQVRLADLMAGAGAPPEPDPKPTPPPKTRQRPDIVLQQSVVRAHAAAALFMLGDTSALDTLTRLLTMNVHPAVRELAAVLLGQSGAGQAVPALSAALNDDDWQVRDAASTALTRIQG